MDRLILGRLKHLLHLSNLCVKSILLCLCNLRLLCLGSNSLGFLCAHGLDSLDSLSVLLSLLFENLCLSFLLLFIGSLHFSFFKFLLGLVFLGLSLVGFYLRRSNFFVSCLLCICLGLCVISCLLCLFLFEFLLILGFFHLSFVLLLDSFQFGGLLRLLCLLFILLRLFKYRFGCLFFLLWLLCRKLSCIFCGLFASLSLFSRGLRVRLNLKGSLVCTYGNRFLSFDNSCLSCSFIEFNFGQSCFLILSILLKFSCSLLLRLLFFSFKELYLILLFFFDRILKFFQLSLFGGDQKLVFCRDWDPASQLADCCFYFLLGRSSRN